MKAVALGSVCEINPVAPRDLDPTASCSFVPMDAVDDYLGTIASPSMRPVAEVVRGSYTYFADGDVLFAKITPCMENGKCAVARQLVGGIGFGSTEFHVLRAGKLILPKWIYYFLRQASTREQAERTMTGSAGQKRVPARFLEDALLPLPPLPEQQRIAAILERADRLRRLRRYALELSEGYLQAVFVEMFGDPVRNPKGWKEHPLGSFADIASGVTKGRDFNGKPTVQVPYLRVANVQAGFLDLSEVKMIEALPAEVQALRLKVGDVLMTEGGDFDKLGRGTIWHGQVDPCIHQNHIFRVRLDREQVLPAFFASLLLTRHAKAYFLTASKQTTNLATINMTQLKAFPVPVPPVGLQRQFVRINDQHDRLRAQQREALRQAEQLFAALLARAFRGEL